MSVFPAGGWLQDMRALLAALVLVACTNEAKKLACSELCWPATVCATGELPLPVGLASNVCHYLPRTHCSKRGTSFNTQFIAPRTI